MSRPDRIHFGSCNSQYHEPILWPHMAQRQAAAFVWVGDAVYGDDFEIIPVAERTTLKEKLFQKRKVDATPDGLKALYRHVLETPSYRAYTHVDDGAEAAVRPVVMGTFDDHDYGRNNGDRTFPYKRESAVEYMDFIQKSNYKQHNGANQEDATWKIMTQRAAAGKGLYGVKVLDFSRPPGHQLLSDEEAGIDHDVVVQLAAAAQAANETVTYAPLSNRSVAIFVLDCRSNKDPWRTPNKTFSNDNDDFDGDFLGAEQWKWFEESIQRSTAAVNVIAQGLQVHGDKFFNGNVAEEWSRFPRAQHRLYQAILQPSVQSPILVSGDIHMAQIMRRDCRRVKDLMVGQEQDDRSIKYRPLYEMTTSGMTHSWGSKVCARPKEISPCQSTYFNKVVTLAAHLAHNLNVWTEMVHLDTPYEPGAKTGVQYTLERNFGEMEFDWEKRQVTVRVMGQHAAKSPILSNVWSFDALSGRVPLEERSLVPQTDYSIVLERYQAHQVVSNSNNGNDDWICINNRGLPAENWKMYGFFTSVGFITFMSFIPFVLPGVMAFLMMTTLRRRRKK